MYSEALTEAMAMLAAVPESIFVGQAVAYDGQAAFKTFAKVPMEKRLEMPVVEDFQLGFCTGLAEAGFLPICFYPRWDFLIMASNQLLNHLDKISEMWGAPRKVIIRVAVGRREPLDPGPQHVANYTHPIRQMLKTVRVYEMLTTEDVMPMYQAALVDQHPAIMVEHMRFYDS